MPGHDALPPPRLRPFARILLIANIVLISTWLTLNLLVQQGLMTLPFADPDRAQPRRLACAVALAGRNAITGA